MIIITDNADAVIAWIEENCAPPSRYTTGHAWSADRIAMTCNHPVEIELHLTDTDQCLFDLYHAGRFVQSKANGRWYDDTATRRMMIQLLTVR